MTNLCTRPIKMNCRGPLARIRGAPILAVACFVLGSTTIRSAAVTLFVDASATGSNNGRNWDDAFTDLQEALAVATPIDAIWVAAGIYTPDGDTGDRNATFQLLSGLGLYAGPARINGRFG